MFLYFKLVDLFLFRGLIQKGTLLIETCNKWGPKDLGRGILTQVSAYRSWQNGSKC